MRELPVERRLYALRRDQKIAVPEIAMHQRLAFRIAHARLEPFERKLEHGMRIIVEIVDIAIAMKLRQPVDHRKDRAHRCRIDGMNAREQLAALPRQLRPYRI